MKRLTLGFAAFALMLSPIAASASSSEDVDAQLRAMQERMSQLENKLEATTDELEAANSRLEAQQHVINRVESDVSASSGLSSFLDTVEIGGWMAASYNYNWQNPDPSGAAGSRLRGFNGGLGGLYYPFQPDTNAFQMDQFWLEIERAVSQENRAGFRADIVMGKTADILNGVNDGVSGSQNDFNVYQAYIQYLAPIGDGITFKLGKFATLIGAEVAQAPYNYNITRGQVYNLFQPINNVGILASTTIAGLDVNLGFVNDTRSAIDIDVDTNKAFVGSIGQSTDGYDWQFAGTYGSAQNTQNFGGGALAGLAPPTNPVTGGAVAGGKAGDTEMILDAIVKVRPTDSLEAYINADYIQTQWSGASQVGLDDTTGWGIAVASRYAFTDRLGLAVRGEYFTFDNFANIGNVSLVSANAPNPNVPPLFGTGVDFQGWGLTTTMDYQLAENLSVKGEVRYDRVEQGTNTGGFQSPPVAQAVDQFFDDNVGGGLEEDQLVGAVQVIYSF